MFTQATKTEMLSMHTISTGFELARAESEHHDISDRHDISEPIDHDNPPSWVRWPNSRTMTTATREMVAKLSGMLTNEFIPDEAIAGFTDAEGLGWLHYMFRAQEAEVRTEQPAFEKGTPSRAARKAAKQEDTFNTCPTLSVRTLLTLIRAGCDVNKKTKAGSTPLHFAAPFSYWMTHTLIANGADINAVDKYGDTPLHHACYGQNVGTARQLIAAGADTTIKDSGGNTPYVFMVNCGGNDDLFSELDDLHPDFSLSNSMPHVRDHKRRRP